MTDEEEKQFQEWYAKQAALTGMDPNPDDPRHHYDMRAAWKSGAEPKMNKDDGLYHWPSQFKDDNHPNRFVFEGGNLMDTRTMTPADLSSGGAPAPTFARGDVPRAPFDEQGEPDPQVMREWYNPATWFKPDEVVDTTPPLARMPPEGNAGVSDLPPLAKRTQEGDPPEQLPPMARRPSEPQPNQQSLAPLLQKNPLYQDEPQLPLSANKNSWPTHEDVLFNKKVDATYGNPVAPWLEGKSIKVQNNFPQILSVLDSAKNAIGGESKALTKEQEAYVYTGFVAAQRSPTAALGFDPRRVITSEFPKGKALYGANGMFNPLSDEVWVNMDKRSNIVHESLHRGMYTLKEELQKKLENKPSLLASKDWPSGILLEKEETIVRALMQRHFGDIETLQHSNEKQIQEGKDLLAKNPGLLDWIESKSAELYAKKHAKGPR